jgi:hypothetical protein
MPTERKIRLAEVDHNATRLTFWCSGQRAGGVICTHHGSMSLEEAWRRWPGDRRLDELGLVRSICGSREIDVRPGYAVGAGGKRRQI